jgi:hypothetical protein
MTFKNSLIPYMVLSCVDVNNSVLWLGTNLKILETNLSSHCARMPPALGIASLSNLRRYEGARF